MPQCHIERPSVDDVPCERPRTTERTDEEPRKVTAEEWTERYV